jgi:hypothetical protein
VAKVYIQEFASTAIGARGQDVAAPQYPAVAKQPVMTSTGTTQQSAAFGGSTRFVEYHTDGIISIDIGPNPIADVNYDRVGAGERVFVGVQPGHKLAIITNT